MEQGQTNLKVKYKRLDCYPKCYHLEAFAVPYVEISHKDRAKRAKGSWTSLKMKKCAL